MHKLNPSGSLQHPLLKMHGTAVTAAVTALEAWAEMYHVHLQETATTCSRAQQERLPAWRPASDLQVHHRDAVTADKQGPQALPTRKLPCRTAAAAAALAFQELPGTRHHWQLAKSRIRGLAHCVVPHYLGQVGCSQQRSDQLPGQTTTTKQLSCECITLCGILTAQWLACCCMC